jgi:hypothetical protein
LGIDCRPARKSSIRVGTVVKMFISATDHSVCGMNRTLACVLSQEMRKTSS